ncbi:MAG TPA: HlyD family efflux transporter periplasmic adaptor subunit [Thermoanaerobaculia bacterium]|nr:HlyD family efflux transporter periplasmic adaptor subunit [Thermoanaerobaculia bacterium]
MTRRRIQWLWISLGSLALLCVSLAVASAVRQDEETMPTITAVPVKFERRVTAEGNLVAKTATKVSLPPDTPPLKIGWIADDGSSVKAGDVVVRFDPTEFETELEGGQSARDIASNKQTSGVAESGATRRNLVRDAEQAEKELRAAQERTMEDIEIFSRYEAIESGIDQDLARHRRAYAQDSLEVRETLSRAESALIGIETSKAMIRIRNAERGLKSLEIVAPHDGILVLRKDWRGETPRVGSTVFGGQPVGEIPDVSAMQAEVFVLEADAAGLAVDQKGTLTVESKPGQSFAGVITRVDKLARPRVRNVPVQYFGVTLTLDKTDTAIMKPGARVRAVLDIEQQSDVFAVPRQAVFDRRGEKVVYRKDGNSFQPAVIEIGSSSPGRIIVTKGINAGDVIALREPESEDDETASQSKRES